MDNQILFYFDEYFNNFHDLRNDYKLINDIKKYNPHTIFIFNAYESTFYFENVEIQKLVEDEVKNRGIEFYIIFGNEHKTDNQYIIKNEHMKFLYWPTFLLHVSYYNGKYTDMKFQPNTKFEKLYSFYNMRPKTHRSMLIDLLYHNNLFDCGNITWNLKTKQVHNIEYEFQFWKEEIIKRGHNNVSEYSKLFDEYSCHYDLEFFNDDSLIHIIGETFNHINFITEKTYKPILINKIFLCLGAPDCNNNLKKYGFKLFEEIFDYSFDSEKDTNKRVDGVFNNLKNIKGKNYNEIYKMVEKKILHNKKKYIEILHKDEFIPKEFVDFYVKNKSYFNPNSHFHNMLNKILINY